MAIGDIGLFSPAESAYATPSAYSEALRANALRNAEYLAMMDQFYEQLEETKREFDATLGFKESALAQEKWIAEQEIGLKTRQLDISEKLGMEELSLRERELAAETEYRSEALDIERLKINSSTGLTSLPLTSYEKKKMYEDALTAFTNAAKSLGMKGSTSTSGPKSGEVTTYSSAVPDALGYNFSADHIYSPAALSAAGFRATNVNDVTDYTEEPEYR